MSKFHAALILSLAAAPALADDSCATGHTMTEGVLTVATGNPAYFPWVIDDTPESGQGFEAAVAYALADQMGFDADHVSWVRTSFDQAIQPGAKGFDINLQQFSITEEREEVIDFSDPYYSSAMAVLTTQAVIDAGAEAEMDSLRGLKWGVMGGTTNMSLLMDLIAPERTPLVYNDNADVTAAIQAGQIEAALFDLPTALYLSAVVVEGGALLGQFPAERTANPDSFGILMAEGSALKPCVDAALADLRADGTLAALEAEWLAQTTGVPVVE